MTQQTYRNDDFKFKARIVKPRNHWRNMETLSAEAKRYQTRKDFAQKSKGAYYAANKLRVLNQICAHMKCRYNTARYRA